MDEDRLEDAGMELLGSCEPKEQDAVLAAARAIIPLLANACRERDLSYERATYAMPMALAMATSTMIYALEEGSESPRPSAEVFDEFVKTLRLLVEASGATLNPAPEAIDEAKVIRLTPAEIQSGMNRVSWAEGLIRQLPDSHQGRNTWLMNYGVDPEAQGRRVAWHDRHACGRTMDECFPAVAQPKPAEEPAAPERPAPEIAPWTPNDIANQVCQVVCELPDRTSPFGDPDMLLVRPEELALIIRRALGEDV